MLREMGAEVEVQAVQAVHVALQRAGRVQRVGHGVHGNVDAADGGGAMRISDGVSEDGRCNGALRRLEHPERFSVDGAYR